MRGTAFLVHVQISSRLAGEIIMGVAYMTLPWWRPTIRVSPCPPSCKRPGMILHVRLTFVRDDVIKLLLALREGSSPVIGEFSSQMPVMRSFDVFFDLRLNKRLSRPPRGRWSETPSRSLWRQCNVIICLHNFYIRYFDSIMIMSFVFTWQVSLSSVYFRTKRDWQLSEPRNLLINTANREIFQK